VVFLFAALLGDCTTSSSVAGVYVGEQNPPSCIELKKNATFEMYFKFLETEFAGHGKYVVSADLITFKFLDDTRLRGTIAARTLQFPDNSVRGLMGRTVWHRK